MSCQSLSVALKGSHLLNLLRKWNFPSLKDVFHLDIWQTFKAVSRSVCPFGRIGNTGFDVKIHLSFIYFKDKNSSHPLALVWSQNAIGRIMRNGSQLTLKMAQSLFTAAAKEIAVFLKCLKRTVRSKHCLWFFEHQIQNIKNNVIDIMGSESVADIGLETSRRSL